MKFTPRENDLIEAGNYQYQVIKATDEKSKKTNADMIKLQIAIYQDGNQIGSCFDYLMDGRMQYKLRHFCQTTGLSEQFAKGDLSANDCINKIGWCKVGIKKATDDYPEGNTIIDYIDAPMTLKTDKKNEDIPF